MAYKWKPSKSARREFAQSMANDAGFAADYYARKEARADKRRATSQFDYATAGGEYTPTREQYLAAIGFIMYDDLSLEQENACRMVQSAHVLNEKCHHDYIHIVNELTRQDYGN